METQSASRELAVQQHALRSDVSSLSKLVRIEQMAPLGYFAPDMFESLDGSVLIAISSRTSLLEAFTV